MRFSKSKSVTVGDASVAAAPSPVAVVQVLTDKELLRMHGPTGGLILRLQRQSVVGYLFGLAALGLFGVYVIIQQLFPTTLVLDEENRVIGSIHYSDTGARRDIEYVSGVETFLRCYMSSDSHYIFDDYACALSMMDDDLRKARMDELKRDNMQYLNNIQSASVYGRVEFERDGVRVISRHDDRVIVRARGNVVAQAAGGSSQSRWFDVTLTTHAVARTNDNHAGIRISKMERN
ncbi:MAG: hypothetical protein AABY83_15295 [Pseudomonadota bacterium]